MNLGISLGLCSGLQPLFSPQNLLAGSTALFLLDFSDLTTMFQDTAGTTPVTAPAQTVGLVLDKSQGLVLGPELVMNGDFSGGISGWSGASATVSVDAGTLRGVGGGVGTGFYGSGFSVVSGSYYRFTFSIRGDTAYSGLQFGIRRTSSLGAFISSAVSPSVTTSYNNVSFVVQATATVADAVFFCRFSGTEAVNIDNISVRELPGFHATQSTAANRPTYGVVPSRGRVNLLTFSEAFDNAAWTKSNTTVTANASVAPDGATTADKLVETTATSTKFVLQPIAVNSGAAYTYSVFLKAAERNFAQVRYENSTSTQLYAVNINLLDGSFNTLSSGSPTGTSATVNSVGSGWYRVQLTVNASDATFKPIVFLQSVQGTNSYTGDGTSGILIWGAQLEVGSTATTYQRVLHYLYFGGDLDPRWLQTATITPSADKVQVFAGVRKLSDAAQGILLESSTTSGANNGAFALFAPGSVGATYLFQSRGTASSGTVVGTFAAPISNVLTTIGDIAADTAALRANGVEIAAPATDQGTGNYLAYPMFIGRRGGTSNPYNGYEFGLIVRFGPNLSTAQIASVEDWLNTRTGAY